ncbi:DNA polymerase III, delta subunit [Lachnospiraceae bacterium]|nr:DNA polymerase III, delta subunit [Lachnospiraceae bacterium]
MNEVAQDIKNQDFKRVYLLCGEEAYLRELYRKKLIDAVTPPGDTMNTAFFSGKDINIASLIDLGETMPFMAPRRLIVVDGSGLFKGAVEDRFVDYMSNIPEDTVFVFNETEVDKRSRMYKAVQKNGHVAECGVQDEKALKLWLAKLLDSEGKKVRGSTLERMIAVCGTDMNNLQNEAWKLISYTGDRDVVEDADIDAICTPQISNAIFDMVDAIANGRQKQALDLYYDMLLLKEPPMRILYMIAREFNLLLQTRVMAERRASNKEIAGAVKINPYFVRKYIETSSRYKTEELRQALKDCVSAEEDVKTGKIADKLSVELLIVKYSGGQKAIG